MWAKAAFGVAVIAGTSGALLLALGKALALPLSVVSLIGVVAQKLHDFVIVDSMALYGAPAVVMTGLVLVGSALLIALAKKGKDQRWLT